MLREGSRRYYGYEGQYDVPPTCPECLIRKALGAGGEACGNEGLRLQQRRRQSLPRKARVRNPRGIRTGWNEPLAQPSANESRLTKAAPGST